MKMQEYFELLDYHNYAAYVDLAEGDQAFFDKLFPILLKEETITFGNDKLAAIVHESKSTVEKRLKRIDEAGLIIRETAKQCDRFGEWRIVERVIRLNSDMFSYTFNYYTKQLYLQYLFDMKTRPLLQRFLEMDKIEFDEFVRGINNDNL